MEQLRMVTKNNNQANEKFLSREPIVLLPILGLMVLKGVGSTVEQERFLSHVQEGQLSNAFRDHFALQTFASVLGFMLVPCLADIHGRKPVFILLFTLALLSSILNYVPYQNPWPMIETCIVNALRGGVLTITALSICEYCSPEHRFAWLVASEFMKMFSASVTSILYGHNGVSKVSSYGSLREVLVAVVCLACLYWWPESPYWLASQGRQEESKAALLWLRREGPAARAELTALETARRRPSPKLFWLSLLISLLAVTVAMCAASAKLILMIVNHELETVNFELSHRIKIVCANVLVSVIFVVISYEVKRKALCLIASIIPLVLVYILSIWLCAKQFENHKEAFYITTLICNSLLELPFHLNFTIFIEVVPQKYYTYMSCISSLFFYGISIIFPAVNLAYDDSFPLYGSLLVFATLSLGASGVVYGLSQETAETNVLEIEKKYLTRLYHRDYSHDQIQVIELEEDSRFKEITSAISQSRVSVIVGAAGCGKSTRAPLAVLRSSPDATIIVSGPRRVAAVGLARRVASELGEKVGDTVGYQVRLDSKPPRPPAGSILYCTSGVLLRRLQTNPGLDGCSHVFIDEAHERDVNTDVTLLLLRRAVDINPGLRVVVMSATLDTEVFTRYFNSCPVVEVPGRTFPVETLYLDDIKQKYSLELSNTFENCKREYGNPQVNCQEVVEVVKALDRTEPEGAILVFLPGWAEIKQAKLLLEQCYEESTHLVLPVHSRLSTTDQARMFSKPLPGVRKIVLSTNIAETSITIPDVVYVVDSGAHKEKTLREGTGTASLATVWVSRAAARQRAGRAGRVKPGHCLKLYTKEKEDEFTPFSTPEILRVPLEQTVLDCKTYAPEDKVEDFFSQLPEPPSSKAIELAVNDLIDLGALSTSEQLTRLGSILSSFTVHPRLARGLLASAVLGNTVAFARVLAHCSDNVEVFVAAVERKEEIREIKREFSATSDHAALYWIQEEFERARARGEREVEAWCERYGLRTNRLAYVSSISNQYLGQLLSSSVVQPVVDVVALSRFSGVDALTPAALLCGADALLVAAPRLRTHGKLRADVRLRDSKGDRAHIASSSVSHGAARTLGALFAYFGGVHSRERRALVVHTASRVSPHAALLMCRDVCVDENNDDITVLRLPRHKLDIHVPTSQVDHILKAREMLSSTLQYYVEREPNAISYEEDTTVTRFKVRLVKAIGRILVEANKEFGEKSIEAEELRYR